MHLEYANKLEWKTVFLDKNVKFKIKSVSSQTVSGPALAYFQLSHK